MGGVDTIAALCKAGGAVLPQPSLRLVGPLTTGCCFMSLPNQWDIISRVAQIAECFGQNEARL